MTFHFDEGVVTYRTTFGSRNEDGYKPPSEVRRYMDAQFSKLLLFNGELAGKLITGFKEEHSPSGIEPTDANQIIDTFYGLHHVQELQKCAKSSYEQYLLTRKVSGRAAQVARLENALTKLRARLRILETGLNDSKTARLKLEEEIQNLQKANEDHLRRSEVYRKKQEEAISSREKAQKEIEVLLQKIAHDFPNPVFLNDRVRGGLKLLAENLDTLKLPEPTSRTFFEELLQEPLCICDREMTESAKLAIRRHSNKILGGDINGFLNAFKMAVRAHCQHPCVPSIGDHLGLLNSAHDRAAAAQSQLDDILAQAERQGDAEVKSRTEQLTAKQKRLNEIVAFIEEAERPPRAGDSEDGSCISYFRSKVAEHERLLAQATDSLDRKERTDTLTSVLASAYESAHASFKAAAIKQANGQLRQILKFNLVQISDIDRVIKLHNRSQGSEGQNLTVGYVFLAGVLHGGGNQFPLVVDSPAGKLDDEVRKEVGTLLPKLIKQLVAFVIASERQWFVEPLADSANEDVLYLTHLRLNDYTRTMIIPGLGGDTVSNSDSGVVIKGRDAFFALGEESAKHKELES
jgi:DNA sulfur modification protein DndD